MREVFVGFFITYLYSVIALILVLAVQAAGAWMLLRTPWARSSRRGRAAIYAAALVSFCSMTFGFLLRFGSVNRYFPPGLSNWTGSAALIWAILWGSLALMHAISRLIPPPRKESGIG